MVKNLELNMNEITFVTGVKSQGDRKKFMNFTR